MGTTIFLMSQIIIFRGLSTMAPNLSLSSNRATVFAFLHKRMFSVHPDHLSSRESLFSSFRYHFLLLLPQKENKKYQTRQRSLKRVHLFARTAIEVFFVNATNTSSRKNWYLQMHSFVPSSHCETIASSSGTHCCLESIFVEHHLR